MRYQLVDFYENSEGEYIDGGIDVRSPEQYTIFGNVKTAFLEIVGNIHDTPELLKDGEKK